MSSERVLRNSIVATIIVFGILLIGEMPARAQQTVTSATLSGTVEDSNGSIISGAAMTLTNQETNQQQTATSDVAGRYRFPYVQVGPYQLATTARGFASSAR